MNTSETVTYLIEAIVDSRTDDALRLVDANVIWKPIARPGLSLYQGRGGMSNLIKDIHEAYGQFRVEIKEVTVLADGKVRVLAQAIQETETGDIPVPTSESVFTLKNGLVTHMEARTLGSEV